MNILLWGAGSDSLKLSRLYSLYSKIYNDDISGIIDINSNKWGERLFGKRISKPVDITKIAWDKIVIASTIYDNEIRKQLIEDYQIRESDIISYVDYCYQKVIHYQYKTNIQNNKKCGRCENYRPFDSNSLVVYTAIIGDYDDLKNPVVVEPNVHYVCYTDQLNLKSDIWEIRYVDEVPESERALCVRKFKMLPHKLFPEYETSIWIDASLKIIGNLTELIKKYQTHSNFLMMPHNERICAYEEAFANVVGCLAPKSVITAQISRYLREDFPEDYGLMVGGFLVRNHSDKKIIQAMEDWYREVSFNSSRDQVSLPYAIWKNKLQYDLCDLCIFNNSWMTRIGHKHIMDGRGADKLSSK